MLLCKLRVDHFNSMTLSVSFLFVLLPLLMLLAVSYDALIEDEEDEDGEADCCNNLQDSPKAAAVRVVVALLHTNLEYPQICLAFPHVVFIGPRVSHD